MSWTWTSGVNVWDNNGGGNEVTIEYHDGFTQLTNLSIEAGYWYHFALAYANGSFTLYLNGSQVHQETFTQGSTNGADDLQIGKHNDDSAYGTRRFFKGVIDEVLIWNKTLSSAEIQSRADGEKPWELPPGLTLNANCTISGTPTTATFPTGTWWVNGTNSGGSDWSEITIQVVEGVPEITSISPQTQTGTRGTAITSINVTKNWPPVSWEISPNLPAGLQFNDNLPANLGNAYCKPTQTQFTIWANTTGGSDS